MKRNFIFLSTALFCTLFLLTACNPFGSNDKKEVIKVLERNLKATEAEDIEMVLADIDDGPLKIATKSVLKTLFAEYDLSYKIHSIKILSLKDDTAEVEIEQETKKIKGPAFKDNVSIAVHTLKKRPSGWKIANSEIKSVKFL